MTWLWLLLCIIALQQQAVVVATMESKYPICYYHMKQATNVYLDDSMDLALKFLKILYSEQQIMSKFTLLLCTV